MPRLVLAQALRAAAATPLAAVVAAAALMVPARVLAHGDSRGPIDAMTLVTGWSVEAHVLVPLVLALAAYHWAVRRVDAAHPATPVPRRRVASWDLGLLVLLLSLQSPVATYDTTLFSAHMVQHLLLMMVAAPLLALGAPITLLLRLSSPEARQRWILPVLHARVVRVLAFPVVAWVVFAATLYVSHFSPLFDAALESEPVHLLEHALYLGAALLFWWPAVGADPAPWRLPHAARVLYLFLGMPWSSFLGLAIFSSNTVLYPHYASLARDWGPTPLADQQLAGGIMWAGGDGLFLIALILAVAAWLKNEESEGRRLDAQLDREAAARPRLR